METILLVMLCFLLPVTVLFIGLFVWELLVRFVWREPDLSLLFNRDEW